MTDAVARSAGKERSPNYPSIGLQVAIDFARKLWAAERRTTVPPEVAARALGYNSLSGASRAILAALRQYGLIDVSPGGVTISTRAVVLAVHDDRSEEWREAVLAAATAPDIFREISDTHADASDAALNAYLITRRGFSTEGAKRLVRSFRETRALANRVGQGYSEASGSEPLAYSDLMPTTIATPQAQQLNNQQVGVIQVPISLDVRADIRFVGGRAEPALIRKLGAILTSIADKVEEDT